ncbi:hypothetical protein KKC60_04595, partial [Patescibacteria group bacterium]|nr:hypothetical protein [Patescibacteria group bacterium]
GVEEVDEIYHPDKNFHDYYLELENRRSKNENPTVYYLIFENHIQDLATPEIKNLVEQYVKAVKTSDQTLFNETLKTGQEDLGLPSTREDLYFTHINENTVMFSYYINYLKFESPTAFCQGEKECESWDLLEKEMWNNYSNSSTS